MPVQQVAPPTLSEIVSDLQEFERKYGITTVDFLAKDGRVPEVDDDDAMDWLYRVEQFRTLKEGNGSQNSRTERSTFVDRCASVVDVMDQLAA